MDRLRHRRVDVTYIRYVVVYVRESHCPWTPILQTQKDFTHKKLVYSFTQFVHMTMLRTIRCSESISSDRQNQAIDVTQGRTCCSGPRLSSPPRFTWRRASHWQQGRECGRGDRQRKTRLSFLSRGRCCRTYVCTCAFILSRQRQA